MQDSSVKGVFLRHIILLIVLVMNIYASNYTEIDAVQKLATALQLFAGTKASVQWERVFSSPRKLRSYNLSEVPLEVRNQLKNYLISHAADSDKPIIPGL